MGACAQRLRCTVPDDADLASEATDLYLARSINDAKKASTRRAEFCDCDSWRAGRFCGDHACRDAYERETRRLALHGST
jgi:hypothetical protein